MVQQSYSQYVSNPVSYDNGCIVFSNHLDDAFSDLESSLATII